MEVVLEPHDVGHGGVCVARYGEIVVFVRHTLPGEKVRVRITDQGARFWRGDAVAVLRPASDRVASAWPQAGPGGVGGGELAHVSVAGQLRWKEQVIANQLRRIAGISERIKVEAVPPSLAYRTRISLISDPKGRLGMRGARSHQVFPIDAMPLAVAPLQELGLFDQRFLPGTKVRAVAPSAGPCVMITGDEKVPVVTEQVGDITYRLRADAFWQVHQQAPTTLVAAVLAAAGDVTGQRVWDLYCGAGLFTLPLAAGVGPAGPRVLAIDAVPGIDLDRHRRIAAISGTVEANLPADRPDVVVLDPPRQGAGRQVIDMLIARRPHRIVYVACDPAAFARDAAWLLAGGYQLTAARAFDLFAMTHHVEIVATWVDTGVG